MIKIVTIVYPKEEVVVKVIHLIEDLTVIQGHIKKKEAHQILFIQKIPNLLVIHRNFMKIHFMD